MVSVHVRGRRAHENTPRGSTVPRLKLQRGTCIGFKSHESTVMLVTAIFPFPRGCGIPPTMQSHLGFASKRSKCPECGVSTLFGLSSSSLWLSEFRQARRVNSFSRKHRDGFIGKNLLCSTTPILQRSTLQPEHLHRQSHLLYISWRGVGLAGFGAMNPLQGSGLSKHSRCAAVRMFKLADELSAGIVRVEPLLLWRHAHFQQLAGSCMSKSFRCGVVRLHHGTRTAPSHQVHSTYNTARYPSHAIVEHILRSG